MENIFGKNLKRIRTNYGMSQEELAKSIGYKQGTVSSWEVGRTEPSMIDIYKLCSIFKCSVTDLTNEPDPFKELDKTMSFLNLVDSTNSEFDKILSLSDSLNSDELDKLSKVFQLKAQHKRELEEIELRRYERIEAYRADIEQLLNK